jgi:hypothetical protein
LYCVGFVLFLISWLVLVFVVHCISGFIEFLNSFLFPDFKGDKFGLVAVLLVLLTFNLIYFFSYLCIFGVKIMEDYLFI